MSDLAKPIMIEMGTGTDLHGEDYTKAACRAVRDALQHSSLLLFRSLDIDPNSMRVEITIAVQEPDEVDTEKVTAECPYGSVSAKAAFGGLNIAHPRGGK